MGIVKDRNGNPVRDKRGKPVRSGVVSKDPNQFTGNVAAPGQLSFKRSFNLPLNTGDTIVSESRPEIYRYPSDQTYPASISYTLRKVIPLQEETVRRLLKKSPSLETTKADGASSNPNADRAREEERAATADEGYGDGDYGQGSIGSNAAGGSATTKERLAAKEEAESLNTDVRADAFGMKTAQVDPKKQVILYMPQSLQFQDGVQYSSPNLGAMGATALGMVNNTGSVRAALGEAFSNQFKPITDLLSGRFGDVASDAAALSMSRVATSGVVPEGLSTAAQIGLQVKVNPNTRTVFQGVNIRNFVFTYDFVPRSAEEAEEVKNIIKFFRSELYPSTPLDEATALPLGFKFPHLFEIKVRYNNDINFKVPQPIFCYLRDVQTNYNPNSMSFHRDGNPTQIMMTLNFSEYRTLTKKDVIEGGR